MSDGRRQKLAPDSAGPERSRLFDIASEQGGYFTAEQAAEAGYSRALLSYHAKAGSFIRVRRGLYRLREYPPSPREHVLAAWLAVGKNDAVVSHESALEILGLSDVVPDAVHITVPRTRRNLPSIAGVKIHTSSRPLDREDKVTRDGVVMTSAARSILDAAESGSSPEQIEAAVSDALRRGLTTRERLKRDADERGKRVSDIVSRGLAEASA
jgi:predicted transcriptional regulator of viral defense system